MITLRVHHLLCIGFYTGHGYNSNFISNMNKIVEKLSHANQKIILTTQCDDVCAFCPHKNREDDAVCVLNNNNVHIKDILLLHELGLSTVKSYDAKEIGAIVEKKLTEEIFENSCKKCDWFKKGFCKFKKWENRIGFSI